ncbi:ATP adenylyltransferase [Synechococcus sp. MIT S9509]|uniref:ATP adenylyltransferase n=1 Tax=unclassified Synechococcus TaxID=2626047 RepID=UPI0007BAE65F|nr:MULTISPECIES: ATP adenylyltransferase [unclassified Synechococcus]KZR88021.1 ATP adenylyltransferase [Synechococcus sp. MIT S9504]KZR92194.1 ATP adenylyltransferase [Synechococcus sp. MIT S9509]
MGEKHFWSKALERSEQARNCGALIPLGTSTIELSGPRAEQFELRQLNAALPKHHRPEGPKPNPFLPWDSQLEVERIHNNHVLILNKYPVERGHMLLITQDWASQIHWLQPDDWRALVQVDNDSTGLWFFNSGPRAGASQPHRHLQLLPRAPGERICPRLSWFTERLLMPAVSTCDGQISDPLVDSCVIAERPMSSNPDDQGIILHDLYRSLAWQLGLGDRSTRQPPAVPYNLLLTQSWMALIKRSQDQVRGFSVNALGFAGYLLATQRSDLAWLQSHGGEQLLRQVVPGFSGSADAVS